MQNTALINNFLSDPSWAWLDLTEIDLLNIVNPLLNRTQKQIERPDLDLLRILRNPKYFWFTCKHILNINLHPFQVAILQELWARPFPLFLASRGGGKSFLLAVYATLKCLLIPGTKIIVVGAAFRQAKVIFEYMETIWRDASVLRNICNSYDGKQGPSRDVDRCTMRILNSWSQSIPLGDGSKIRGLRAHTIIADEFQSISPAIYETVVAGFASVSAHPIDNVIEMAKRKRMKKQGAWNTALEDTFLGRTSNQSIITGTADYDFKHFASYWRRYKGIVESHGDLDKITELFDGEVPTHFNWKDYSIIRLPYELLPEGFMDEKTVARSRVTVDTGIYNMEFACCACPETEIITDYGVKKIVDVEVGDMVLTHKGRFRPVVKLSKRGYDGQIRSIKSYGYNQNIKFTPQHPFFRAVDWVDAEKIGANLYLPKLLELNGKEKINLKLMCDDYTSMMKNDKEYIYPRSSKRKLVESDRQLIKNSKETAFVLAKKFNVHFATIYEIKTDRYGAKKLPKNAFPSQIKLDYDFGIIMGYYASEGCVGAEGRCINFSLDGHVSDELSYYVTELSDSIYNVFGLVAKKYGNGSVASICINSRLLGDIIKYICPGDCYHKQMKPEILFSNMEFLKGFIRGYWHGDGHAKIGRNFCSSSSTSSDLSTQLKLALSVFGIAASFNIKAAGECIFRGTLHKTAPAYRITVYSECANTLKDMLGNLDNMFCRPGSQKMVLEGDYIKNRIISNEEEQYNGYVYNLEVDEDNSYCTLSGAVHNCFIKDSQGFFKRSLIESCVASDVRPIGPDKIWFDAAVKGFPDRQYVYGIDPAFARDNFTIVVLELWPNHVRVVHAWSTNEKNFKERQRLQMTDSQNYYGFCARKIRELMKTFPPVKIALDVQGGGVALMETLHDSTGLLPGEVPLWPSIVEGKPKDTDERQGLHILELINFANADWTAKANHDTLKDMQNKMLLFPRFDQVTLGLANEEDAKLCKLGELKTDINKRLYDSLEDCVMEIEDLKDELSIIVCTTTPITGRERWDVPQIKGAANSHKKGALRKDRYSSLILSNSVAREIQRTEAVPEYQVIGRASHLPVGHIKTINLYNSNSWIVDSDVCQAVPRNY